MLSPYSLAFHPSNGHSSGTPHLDRCYYSYQTGLTMSRPPAEDLFERNYSKIKALGSNGELNVEPSGELPTSDRTEARQRAFALPERSAAALPKPQSCQESTSNGRSILPSPKRERSAVTPCRAAAGVLQDPTHRTPRKSILDQNKEPPHTPAPRVPLSQLIGSDEDRLLLSAGKAISPDERVYWQSSPSVIERPPGNRPLHEPSKLAPSTPATGARRDDENTATAVVSLSRTPVGDPASQLWKKYSADSLQENRPPQFISKLLQPEEAKSPNLKRPKSPSGNSAHGRLKRRRTTALEDMRFSDEALDKVGGKGPLAPKARARRARVHELMGRIKRSMDKPSGGRGTCSVEPPRNDSQTSPLHRRSAEPQNISLLDEPDDCDYGDPGDEFWDEVQQVTPATREHQSPNIQRGQSLEMDEFDNDNDFMSTPEVLGLVAQYDTTSDLAFSAPTFGAESGSSWPESNLECTRKIQRCVVKDFTVDEYATQSGRIMTEMVIESEMVSHGIMCRISLRDSWKDTHIRKGQYFNLIGSLDKHGKCTVDDKHNYIILDPDLLISATVVADTVGCLRKAILQERVRVAEDISKPMIYGNILHALFQRAMETQSFSTHSLDEFTEGILHENLQSLYVVHEDVSEAKQYVQSKYELLQNWASTYVAQRPTERATFAENRSLIPAKIAIKGLLEIEEHIWSPLYGIKGNIDATIQAIIADRKNEQTLIMPLELKTGKKSNVLEHRAQTMLYTLLMSDRYDRSIDTGLLYYLETSNTFRVFAARSELRGLIIKRNEVASYIINRAKLPDMIRNEHTCGRCYAKASCFIYHKTFEDGTPESSGMQNAFAEATEHITPTHKAFFRRWDGLLSLEERDSARFKRELWTMTSTERENVGRCLSDLIIIPQITSIDLTSARVGRYTYTFKKRPPATGSNFLESQLSSGDPIVVSDEVGHYALAIGHLIAICATSITVQVDRRLRNTKACDFGDGDGLHLSSFQGSEEVGRHSNSYVPNVVYRVDKDEFSSGMASIRNNLVQLLAPNCNDRLRQLVIDYEAPKFKKPSGSDVSSPLQVNLNADQRRAVEKVLTARDYALILGMPGTGKTTTISHIIRALVSQNKSVLLASYTHTAVDNILLKLKDNAFDILRLGSRSKVHPDVQQFVRLDDTPKTSLHDFQSSYHEPKIVATTCLGINHPLFLERTFDYCIVDEASQITLPVCIGPIRHASAFVLVGDHYQLPPLVRNQEARKGGLDISLFRLLSEHRPEAMVNLEHQYRMCEEVMTLSNELIYSGRLKCGTPEVAQRALMLPNIRGVQEMHRSLNNCTQPCWLEGLLDEARKASFVDTDMIPAREEKLGDRIVNLVEADIMAQIVNALLSCGVSATAIGIITVYRSQLRKIQHLLRQYPAVEMHTADKFQGRDKEVILVSLVRSNEDGHVGRLLQDWRRINVAFTRARSKLVVIGSGKTLSSNGLLKEFVTLMERRRWVYRLPKDAQRAHFLPQSIPQSPPANVKPVSAGPRRVNGKAGVVGSETFFSDRPVLRDILNSCTNNYA